MQIIQSNISDDCVRLIRAHLLMADDPVDFGDLVTGSEVVKHY